MIFYNWVGVIFYTLFFLSLVLSGMIPVKDRWKKYGTIYGAWIVSFWFEMFGFPFTLYVTGSILHVDLVDSADPRPLSGFIGSVWVQVISWSLIVTGISLVILGWAQVYRARGQLVSRGLYGYFRHPQYFGLLLIVTGLLVNFPTFLTMAMYPIMVLTYSRLSKQEERKLEDEFHEYRSRKPRFSSGKLSYVSLGLVAAYIVFTITIFLPGPYRFDYVGQYQIPALAAVLSIAVVYRTIHSINLVVRRIKLLSILLLGSSFIMTTYHWYLHLLPVTIDNTLVFDNWLHLALDATNVALLFAGGLSFGFFLAVRKQPRRLEA